MQLQQITAFHEIREATVRPTFVPCKVVLFLQPCYLLLLTAKLAAAYASHFLLYWPHTSQAS